MTATTATPSPSTATPRTATTTTLVTHEWLRTRGPLATLFGLIALVGVVGSLLGASGWPLLSPLGMALGFLAAVAAVPATQLVLAADYWRSGYGRTGYFTHSLPIRGARIYRVKLAWAMLASLAAIVLTVILALVAWWAFARISEAPGPSWAGLVDVWEAVTAAAPAWMIVAGVLVMLAWVLVWPVFYYFSVSIGHERRLAGLGAGGPIVVFVLVYIAMQALSLLGMAVLPFGVRMGEEVGLVSFNLVDELAAGANTGDVMPIGFIGAMVLLAGFCMWRTARSWNRKVSLG